MTDCQCHLLSCPGQLKRSPSDHPGILKWSQSGHKAANKWSKSGHQVITKSPSSNQMVHRLCQSDHEMVNKWSNFNFFLDTLQQILEVNSYIYAYLCNVCRELQSREWGTINRMNKYNRNERDLIECMIQ